MAAVDRTLVIGAVVLCAVFGMACAASEATSADSSFDADLTEGRTFGHHFLKRISFAMIPAAFVVGVITTLLSALTVVSMKGLGVGVILLVLTISQVIARSFPAPLPAPVPVAYSAPAPAPIPLVYKDCLSLLLLVVLVGCPWHARGEMRKSWKAKSVDIQSQLLKAARLDDPPSAKPPEPSGPEADTASNASTETAAPEKTETEELKPKPSPLFSSRVRTKYGPVAGSSAADPVVEQTVPVLPDNSVRAVPLPLEHLPEEIQVDDATVQDDDDEDVDEADDEDDLLGWGDGNGASAKQYELIENILEEVEARVSQDKRPEAADQGKPAQTPKSAERPKEYTFPPVLNMTIDEPNNIVKVKLNQDIVRDMLSTGRESGGGIGGKKMLRYVLPLFILPFLIQSAVIPFMLTAVKLFLLKSLMAGKLAIFLLLLGAFKNFTKKDRDVYVKDVPDRRYEPSSEGFAYLAEGRPSGWIN
uniref:Protein osiris 22 n=1 Tax=Anopheles dirus TaxID=7168 RepID=A0A182NKV5_9DIPT